MEEAGEVDDGGVGRGGVVADERHDEVGEAPPKRRQRRHVSEDARDEERSKSHPFVAGGEEDGRGLRKREARRRSVAVVDEEAQGGDDVSCKPGPLVPKHCTQAGLRSAVRGEDVEEGAEGAQAPDTRLERQGVQQRPRRRARAHRELQGLVFGCTH